MYTKSPGARSFVAVPAQECPLAQSFMPAFATPKHFSNVGPGSGTGPAALVGAAMAKATAAASADAVRLEAKNAFFMMNPHLDVIGEDGPLTLDSSSDLRERLRRFAGKRASTDRPAN
jgi:hypothetical protein